MAALVMGSLAPAAFASTTTNYTDISGNFAQQDIISLSQQGFIHGYSNGTYRPNDLVTRGQFLAYFMNVVKSVTKVSPGAHQQYFRDIPPRNWDYNYVGAAEAAGWIVPSWIGVKVGGTFNENYQASWGDAASFYVASMERAGKLTSTNGMAPLAYAKSIGLFAGIPSSQNQIYLNRASAAVVLTNILHDIGVVTAPTVASVTLSGGTSMAVNSNEQLAVTLKDASGNTISSTAPVQYSSDNPNNAFVSSSGQLVVTQPGTYHITATVDGVTSAPLTVTVAGAAANVKLSAATPSMVADGTATDTITATLVDVNGNPVTNFNGTMEFRDTGAQLVTANGSLSSDVTGVPVVNGVATIKIQSTGQIGASDTITGTNIVQNGGSTLTGASGVVTGTVSVTQEGQVATSIKVTPALSSIENNLPTEDAFSVQVLDQSGQPMLTGIDQISLSISGPGKFDANTPTTTAYVGNGNSQSSVTGNIWSEQGVSGPITITASAPGLQSGVATVQSVVVGSPAAIKATPEIATGNSIAAGSSSVFNLSTVDTNGNTVSDTANPTYAATIWQGSTQVTSGATATVSGNTVTVSGTIAGSYVLKVTSSDNLTPAMTSFTITPGAATTVSFLSPVSSTIDLPIGQNSFNVQAQLVDAYGNPVSTPGVPVEFLVANKVGADTATLGGSTTGVMTATTGANGQISLPFVGSHTIGDAWTIGIDKVNNATATVAPIYVKMVGAVPTTLHVSMQDTASAASNNPAYLHSTQTAQAGDTVTVTLSPTDSFGNASTNGDLLQVTLPAGLVNPVGLTATSTQGVYDVTLPASGTVSFTATAATAGSYTMQVKDLSVGSLTGSASFNIVAGTAVGAGLFDSAGLISANNPLTVTANMPVQLWLKPVDAEGNPVVEGNAVTYTLGDNNLGGSFRLTETGVNTTTAQLPAGSSGIPVYYVNGVSGVYTLTATS